MQQYGLAIYGLTGIFPDSSIRFNVLQWLINNNFAHALKGQLHCKRIEADLRDGIANEASYDLSWRHKQLIVPS